MELQVRTIHIDTRFTRDKYGSNTDFEIELPQTIDCPPNTVCYVDEIVLPNTITTIQTGVNDHFYFGVVYNTTTKYKYIPIPEQTYTLMSLTHVINSLINIKLITTDCEFDVTYNIAKLTMTFNLTDKRGSKPDVMRWVLFSDDNLKDGFDIFTAIYYKSNNNT